MQYLQSSGVVDAAEAESFLSQSGEGPATMTGTTLPAREARRKRRRRPGYGLPRWVLGAMIGGAIVAGLAGIGGGYLMGTASAPTIAEGPEDVGFIRVVVHPWAEVYVDGRYIDTTPFAGRISLTAGKHKVELVHPRKRVLREVEITAGETSVLKVNLDEEEDKPGRQRGRCRDGSRRRRHRQRRRRIVNRVRRVLFMAGVLLVLVAPAARGEEHVVRTGESFADIAQAFYADPNLGDLVAAANGMDPKTPPDEGARLVIPHARAYKIRGDDTWKALAAKHLGDEGRAPVLARANGFAAESEPPEGSMIFLPFHVERKAEKKDSFKSLAELFYDDPRKADTIKDYNAIGKRKKLKTLRSGDHVIVPVFHARVRPEKLRPATASPASAASGKVPDEPDVGSTLALAEGFWKEGLYARVVSTLARLLSEADLEPVERLRVLELTGASHVALDDETAAIATYRALLTHEPDYSPDPDRTSPKILKVIKKARE